MTMPLFFASNAICPMAIMPSWLKVVAWFNPLTDQVDALRALMLANGTSEFGLVLNFRVMIGTTAALTGVRAALCLRLATSRC
jgi:ABC-2 type transport system permease protein